MKRYIVFLIVILGIVGMTACSKKEVLGDSQAKVQGECLQNAYVNGTYNMAISPMGYYKINGYANRYLSFIDVASGKETFLCNKPECQHMEDEFTPIASCNANVGKVLPGSIVYNDDHIYILEYDQTTYEVSLVRISKDGSVHERIMPVGVAADQSSYYSYVFSDDNTIYMVYNAPDYTGEERTINLEKIDLKNKKKTTVYSYTGQGACIAYLKVLNQDVYFTQVDSVDNMYIYYLMKYNIESQQVEQVLDENINSYVLSENGKLFYFTYSKGIFCYDLNTKERKQIYACDKETQYVSLTYNGKYLVVDNMLNQYYYDENSEHKLFIVDLDGRILNTISAEGLFVELSDKNYVFAEKWGSDGIGWVYIKSDDITKNNATWNIVEEN